MVNRNTYLIAISPFFWVQSYLKIPDLFKAADKNGLGYIFQRLYPFLGSTT